MPIDVYRVEHMQSFCGPWWHPVEEAKLANLPREEYARGALYAFPKKKEFSWFYDDYDHEAVVWRPMFTHAMRAQWSVGCTTLDDLRHWFREDSMLVLLEDYGYVLRRYTRIPDNCIVSDDRTRQCMFARKSARSLETASVLTLAR